MNATAAFRAARVLVVEDEPLMAMTVGDYLRDLGYDVVGPATRLETALDLARSEAIDFALLDINLRDRLSFPVADALADRGIPFIFATGNGRDVVTERHVRAVMLRKPYDLSDLERALGAAELHRV
ncbi:response regulator [Falsirhodobacter sp. 20TX0035]|uniref:response regulator n=1 Tax=Falsirhodobacter sp. 20TX0035 TaxID=3022019 RepID=UPI00232F1CCB|nr:response regulator [Falsirhodobacter sp. 20TX0035]MDB6454340.1 response regulator [Falsirhodobacter sp. 20TX0035]